MYRAKLYYFVSFVLVLAAAGTALGLDPLDQDEGPDGIVSVEAENYDANVEVNGDTWQLTGPTGGFTGEWGMWAPNGQGGGGTDYATDSERLEYNINFVKSGIHYVWILAWGESGTDDSCHAGLDGEATPLSDNLSGWSGSHSWENGRYQRDERAQIDIPSTGLHTLNIWVREDGLIVDKIVLTTNPDYTPTGEGPPESFRGPQLKAYNPTPIDGAQHLETWINLVWTVGDTAVSHDVYMGTNFEDVNNGVNDTFQINQTTDFFVAGFPGMALPEGLVPGTTYFWRIDEIEADGTKYKGNVWSFWIPPINAYDPSPSDGARYVGLDTTLTWQSGLGSKIHNIVFGDNFDEVSNAPAGLSLPDAAFTPGTLEKDKTYYWRVDELNPPTTVKGEVWSFETLPDVPITDPSLIGWWKFDEGLGNTAVDWSGHDNHGSLNGTDMSWIPDGMIGGALSFDGTQSDTDYVEISTTGVSLTAGTVAMWAKLRPDPQSPATRYFFGHTTIPAFSDRIQLYMDNADTTLDLGFGDAHPRQEDIMSLTTDTWYHIALTWNGGNYVVYVNGEEKANGSYTGLDALNTLADIGNDGDTGGRTEAFNGLLDNVRIYDYALSQAEIPLAMRGDPLAAWDPNPSSGSTVYITDATPLSWSAGEKATGHEVYFGLDRDAVVSTDASDTTGIYRGSQNNTTYSPPEGVEWGGGPYYWRIDENNNDGTVSEGSIWSFSVLDFTAVEDFDSYTDNETDEETIWQTWSDGFTDPANGSECAYPLPPYAEQTIVHSGSQSMPLHYNNTAGVTNSEVSLKLDSQRDWTEHGVGELSIWIHGRDASVGSFTEEPVGTYTMTADGNDIWANSDQMHYAYKTLSGIGSITVKVESLQNTDPFAKAGVMIRASLDPDSPYASLLLTPANGVRFQYRQNAGDTTDREFDDTLVAPYWVRLERDAGGSFRGYTSADGSNWQQFTLRPMVSMDTNVYIGLALTSHVAGVTCEAVFSNVATTGNVTGQWTSQDIGIIYNDAEPLYVALYNAAGSPAVVAHPDPVAANITAWTEWVIPLQDFADKGINLSNVDKMGIGLGSAASAATGGKGIVFIDDIRLYRARPAAGQ